MGSFLDDCFERIVSAINRIDHNPAFTGDEQWRDDTYTTISRAFNDPIRYYCSGYSWFNDEQKRNCQTGFLLRYEQELYDNRRDPEGKYRAYLGIWDIDEY